jgi:carboxypeptidase C (cathepsin A)
MNKPVRECGSNGLVLPRDVVALRQGCFGGSQVDYRAELGSFPVNCSTAEEPLLASVVATSYLADRVNGKDVVSGIRPVIFFFNGGPISPSVFLHMLAFGPVRFRVPKDLQADPAGFVTADNPDALLDVADLVFFDPPGTGFSHTGEGTAADAFFSVERDAEAFVAFARSWCERHGRTRSPKYVFGESYGTLRAAVSAGRMLQGDSPLGLDGVYLFGQALNIVETVNRPENVMSYVVSLPTLAALGAYHRRSKHAGRDLAELMEEVSRYAESAYLQALVKGQEIGDEELRCVAAKLEDYTGLAAAEFMARRLRVSKNDYRQLLFRESQQLLGGQDGRYLGTGGEGAADPAGVFYPALQAAHRRHIGELFCLPPAAAYVTESPVSNGLEGWKWGGTTPFSDWRYGKPLAEAMQLNPALQLVVGVGYHDTFTTYGAALYAIRQSDWPRERVALKAYEGGHMAYTVESSFLAMMRDVREWISAPPGMEADLEENVKVAP